jgi:hypothetical protein
MRSEFESILIHPSELEGQNAELKRRNIEFFNSLMERMRGQDKTENAVAPWAHSIPVRWALTINTESAKGSPQTANAVSEGTGWHH